MRESALVLLYSAYGLGAVFGILFLISLSRTDWYHHTWGRQVFVFDALLTAVELFAVSGLLFRDWPGRLWIGVGLVMLISVAQCWRWIIQIRGNRRQRAARREALRRAQLPLGG